MTHNPDPRAIFEGAAEVIGTCFPDVAARLLVLHVPDHAGRCRGCRCGNRPAPSSPCSLRVLAEIATAGASGTGSRP
jgi:hypothetical protein